MKKLVSLLFILYSFSAFAQEHWEDGFWKADAKKHYEKNLTLAGMYTGFYKDGKIKWQGKCLGNGDPDSVWVYYNEQGKKLWEGSYNGKYIEYKYIDTYYGDSETPSSVADTSIIGNYKNGKKEGEWLEYDYSGRYISKKGYYHNGEPTGVWQEFKEVTITTAVEKATEYNYATQTQNIYTKDSISKKHIDSLEFYNSWRSIKPKKQEDEGDDHAFIDFIGSGQMINLKPLNNYFIQKNYKGLVSPLYGIGFGYGGVSDRFYWSQSFNWIPAIYSQLNDSVKLALSGGNAFLNFGVDVIRSNAVDLAPTVGIGFEQLKLVVSKTTDQAPSFYNFNQANVKTYRNPSAVLTAMINLRFNMESNTTCVSMCFSGGYTSDLSSTKWKSEGKVLSDSPKTSLTGFTGIFSLGFSF